MRIVTLRPRLMSILSITVPLTWRCRRGGSIPQRRYWLLGDRGQDTTDGSWRRLGTTTPTRVFERYSWANCDVAGYARLRCHMKALEMAVNMSANTLHTQRRMQPRGMSRPFILFDSFKLLNLDIEMFISVHQNM